MFHHIAWAMKADTPDALSKWLLVCLADHTNQEGMCWPSIATLAERTRMGTSTVCRKLVMLERAGFIKRKSGYEGMSTRYWLIIPEGDKVAPERDNPTPEWETKLPVNNKTLPQLPPDDWIPDDKTRTSINDIAFSVGKEINHELEAYQFIAYCHANNKVYRNIPAAYRSWCARIINGGFGARSGKNVGRNNNSSSTDNHGGRWGEYLSAIGGKT